ncbi:hypothetical protein AVEN_177083-1 [Araneus ventricosus]|uniref:Uncharacterized protein n=1 Tax=Araneus ventricosus TaxID=182803 RepID=A0A4Y2CRT2_ARAVE|nr:hypothetical protein AVEN_177083-1 [Araneus ventricosus]
MQKVNEIFGLLSPKQLTTLDNKTLRDEAATTLANLYPHDLEKDELAVEIESFKYSVIGNEMANFLDSQHTDLKQGSQKEPRRGVELQALRRIRKNYSKE